MPRTAFVTVGSTRFDKLVAATSSVPFLHLLHSLGYTHVSIQHGAGPEPPAPSTTAASMPILDSFDYKSNLRQSMDQADLIISHAGSGSILEALRLKKPLIVVANEDLMDNHQMELGSALQEKNYLVCCTVK
ncbi:hypothetical protein BGZ83_006996 [Gryganskiella cystojenkinii]|nr:hypothetical protein BGZ83_006996 [Gryganskiella cystojenkinii]